MERKRDGENLVRWPSKLGCDSNSLYTATNYTHTITGMSSLFGNRAGAVSSPSDSAAKAQQIKQEVAQQLGTLPVSLYACGRRVLTECTHSPRECSGTHQRAPFFWPMLCSRDPL